MLASRLVLTHRSHGYSQKGQTGSGQRGVVASRKDITRSYVTPFDAGSNSKGRSSSQENIVATAHAVASARSDKSNSDYDMDDLDMRGNVITKTVEYTISSA